MIARLWSTQTESIVDWQKASDVITSMNFSPDGRRLLLGLYKGQCLVFAVDSFKFGPCTQSCRLSYIAMINCRNRYGTYSGGRKVTGIYFINNSEALVTTADSRLRVINLDVSPVFRPCRTSPRSISTRDTRTRRYRCVRL